MKKFILILAALFAVQFSFAQKTDLKYNLKIGNEYTQTQDIKGTSVQNVMGMAMETTVNQKYTMVYKVKSFSDGIYDLEVFYKTIVMEVGSSYGSFTFDSETGSDSVSEMLKGMKSKPFGMKMNVKGEVVEVIGADKILTDALAVSKLSAMEKAQAEAQLANFFSEESLKSDGLRGKLFPAHEVAPGDNWTVESSISEQGMEMNMKTVYEFAGKQGDNWVIRGKSTIETPAGAQIEAQGMFMDVVMKGSMTLEMKVDAGTGWIVEGTAKQSMDGNITAEIPMQGTMDIGLKTSNDVKVVGTK